jgi:hypothetical protein
VHWLYHGGILLEKHEHFQKRTWRNKTAILGPDQALHLTVPLQKGKHQQMKIDHVRIAYDVDWSKTHLGSIKTTYGKTAFSEEVIAGLDDLLTSKFETLWDLNLSALQYFTSLLGGHWKLDFTTIYTPFYSSNVVDLRAGVPGGFPLKPDIELPTYPQVLRMHHSHLPNLSILDVLCHLGPDTYGYLVRYAEKLYAKS